MRPRLISLGGLALLLMCTPAWGALGFGDIVFDPTNYWENLATAISTAATVTEAVKITENTLLNIQSLHEVVLATSGYGGELAALVVEAEGILGSLNRVAANFNALFGKDALPTTAYAYEIRRSEIYQYKYEAALLANRVQRLISSAGELFGRINRFIGSITAIVGGKQATLTVLQAQLETVRQLERSEVRQTALDHLQVIEKMDEASSIESLRLIAEDAFKNW